MSDFKFLVFQDLVMRRCYIVENEKNHPMFDNEELEFIGYAKDRKVAYAIVDYTYEMDR